MKKLPGSLEIKLHEKLSKNDILNILAEHMTMLEETFGIEEFKLYSYLECYRENNKQALYHKERNIIIGAFNLRSQDNVENTAKLISKEGSNRLISFEKKLDTNKIITTVENVQVNNPYRYWSKNIEVIPASLVNNIIQNEHNRQQSESEQLYLLKQQYKKEEQTRKAKLKEEYERPLKSLISRKINESGLSESDFKRIICSSYDYLKKTSIIEKYFCERPDLLSKYNNSRLIRLSLKNTEGKVGKIELYNEDGDLIFERYK